MKFVLLADLWTLAHHPSRLTEWDLDRKLREIKAAGLTGICAPLDTAIACLARANGLFAIGRTFPDDPAEFPRLVRTQKEFGAIQITAQLGTHRTSAADALKRWIRLENEAERQGLVVSLQIHRDSVSETLEKVFELADQYEKLTRRTLRLAWDFSHFGIVQQLCAGSRMGQLLTRPDLLQNATQFHFCPSNSHHAQLPVTDQGKLTPELLDYLLFAQKIMQLWKSDAKNKDREMLGCPALGPKSGYALSSFPPVWPDALVFAAELTKRWELAGESSPV